MDLSQHVLKLLTGRRRLGIEVLTLCKGDMKIKDLDSGEDVSNLVPIEFDQAFRAAAVAWPCEILYEEFVRDGNTGTVMAARFCGPKEAPSHTEGGGISIVRRKVKGWVASATVSHNAR